MGQALPSGSPTLTSLNIALGTGDLVIISEYSDGRLRDRSLAHRQEALELRYMQTGDEIRVLRLPDRNSGRG